MPRRAVFPGATRTTAYGIIAGLCAAAPADATPGGTPASMPPKISSVECRSACAGVAYARTGSTLLLKGRDLDTATTVTFAGGRGTADDVVAKPQKAAAKKLTVRVPRGAASGPLTVTNTDGATSVPTRRRITIETVQTRKVEGGGAGPGIEIAVTGRKVFFDAERRPTLTYVVRDANPVKVVVEVVRVTDGTAVTRFDQGLVPSGEERLVSWDGKIAGSGVAPDGRYEFRVFAESADGARANSAQAGPPASGAPPSPDSFVMLGHKFPVRGAHDYGSAIAAFGGGRNHKGQDVFARCGTPLVAARGGVVKLRATHSRAGNYVIIDGEQTGQDYIYMHLRDVALVNKNERVRTGQLIGYVGDTGRATGCHLHFELWSAPGWYTGGSPFDPAPALRAWDKTS